MRKAISLALLSVTVMSCASSDEPIDERNPTYEEDAKADGAFEDNLSGMRNEWGEIIRPDEALVFMRLASKINELQHLIAGVGEVKRGFHAKVHACMKAELRINANRPAETRFGLFASDGTKQAWVRLSNGQGKAGADNDRDVRGIAIKVMGVEGERLLGDDAVTQDFLMTTRPASHVNDAVEFMEFAEAAATNHLLGWGLKHPVAASRLFSQTAPVKSLVTSFWSGSPYRVGPRVAKFKVWSCAGQPTSTQGGATGPDYLRADFEARLAAGDVCYEFGVQLRKDPANESVEKASNVWSELRNPFIPVGQLVLHQRSVAEARADEEYCNDLAFNPWNGVVEHQPLGHMNRARRPVYMASAGLRGHLPEPRPE